MKSKYLKHKESFENAFGVKLKIYRNDLKIVEIIDDNLFKNFIKHVYLYFNMLDEKNIFDTEDEFLTYKLLEHKKSIKEGILYLFFTNDPDEIKVSFIILRKFKLEKLLHN